MNVKDMRCNESVPEEGTVRKQNRGYKGRGKGGYRQETLFSRGRKRFVRS
jgi:hypothetical protein